MLTRGTSILVALSVVVTVLLGGPPGAAAAADEVEIVGRGYGHGAGLSQWGAMERGEAGHSYRRILKHYYAGATIAKQRKRTVNVLITADTTRDVVVEDAEGLRVTAIARARSWEPQVRAKLWRITPGPEGRSVVSYRTKRWHEWRTFRGEAQFRVRGGGPLVLVTPEGRTPYRGALRSARPPRAGMDRDTVNAVPLEAYLRGVVPSEVIASVWPRATLQAQSVAARTYALHEMGSMGWRYYHLCDTALCQVYGGVDAEYPTTDRAIRDTRRQVLVDTEDEPIFAQFTASNGGWSVAGRTVHLPAREDRYDRFNPDGGPVGWETSVTVEDITRHWQTDIGDFQSITVEARDGRGTWGGRATEVLIRGSEGSITTSGNALRRFLGLRSDFFCFPGHDDEC